MPRTAQYLTEQERKEADAARQYQKRHQRDAKAHHQQRINNPQLHNFARDFSEDVNHFTSN